jgi:hypothetical protein
MDTRCIPCEIMWVGIIRLIGQVATVASVGGLVISRRVPGEGDAGADAATTKLAR